MLYELYGLMFNVAECGSFKVSDKVRRDSEDSADFVNLIFPRFEELCVFGCDAYGVVFHALFKHRYLMAVSCSLIDSVPRFSEFFRVFEDAGVFEDTSRSCTIAEEFRTVFLGRKCQAYSFSHLCNGTDALDSVIGQPLEVEDLTWLIHVSFVCHIVRVCVLDFPGQSVSLDRHVLRFQVPKLGYVTLSADDSCITVAPKQNGCHHHLSEFKRGHFLIWHLIKARKKRMLLRKFVMTVFALFE